jgi:hypothetical protein
MHNGILLEQENKATLRCELYTEAKVRSWRAGINSNWSGLNV